MNKFKILSIIIVGFFILLYFYNKKFTLTTYYYPSGELKSKFYKLPGKLLCGYEYYESGAVHYYYCKTQDSGINGIVKKYYETGELFSKVNFINHKREGVEQVFSIDGKLIQDTRVQNKLKQYKTSPKSLDCRNQKG
jgi:antitoxin component YwqK of YwqJK toxin-antitoxin module